MKTQWKRIGSVLLPAFALASFILIVLGNGLGHEYFIDLRAEQLSKTTGIVLAVGPSAAAAGIRPGDRYDRGLLPTAQWFRSGGMVFRGQTVPVPIVRGGAVRVVEVPAVSLRNEIPLAEMVVNSIVAAFSLGLLAYVGFRRPSVLVALLIAFVGGALLSWPHFMSALAGLPDSLFGPTAYVLRTLCGVFPVALLASFAIRLGTDNTPRRRTITRVVDGIVLLAFFVDGFVYTRNLYIPEVVIFAALLLVSSVISLALAKPGERNRVGIVFAAIMIGGVGYAIAMLLWDLRAFDFSVFIVYVVLSVVIIPLALAYAILRHHVFDVTFVLNRTIVYAVTSAVLLIVFAALEFAAERYLTNLTHIASAIVEFLIALAVIVSARLVHSRVDRFVDSVLFRARHEQELALRRFATTVQFYTKQQPLVHDAVEILVRHGSVSGAAVYLTGGGPLQCAASSFSDAPKEIDENDLAYVELRAHRQTLDLHRVTTSLPGIRLYPMTLSGRLVGAVVIGERHGGEQTPPDIEEAIARVAESIAISIAAIETDAIRYENALLQQRLSSFAPAN